MSSGPAALNRELRAHLRRLAAWSILGGIAGLVIIGVRAALAERGLNRPDPNRGDLRTRHVKVSTQPLLGQSPRSPGRIIQQADYPQFSTGPPDRPLHCIRTVGPRSVTFGSGRHYPVGYDATYFTCRSLSAHLAQNVEERTEHPDADSLLMEFHIDSLTEATLGAFGRCVSSIRSIVSA